MRSGAEQPEGAMVGRGAASANDEPNAKHENCPTQSHCSNIEGLIAKGVKHSVKALISNNFPIKIAESPNDILRKSLHREQNGI